MDNTRDEVEAGAGAFAQWGGPFVAHLAGERRVSPYTLRNYTQALVDFLRWAESAGRWSHDGPAGVRVRDLRDYLIESQRHLARRTVHNHFSALRAFFRYWMRQGVLKVNPAAGLVLPRLSQPLPRFMTEG